MLFRTEHVHARNYTLEKPNVTRKLITKTAVQTFKRKMLEVCHIRKFKPRFNNQKDIKIIHLFINWVTGIPEGEILIIN